MGRPRQTRRLDWALVFVATLMLDSCSRTAAPPETRIEPALEKLIPGDTVVLAGVRVTLVESSPVYARLMKGRMFPELDQFAQQTGLDPRRDLKEVLLASNGSRAVVIAKGRVEDVSKLEALLESKGAQRFRVGPHTLLGNEQAAVCFLSNSVAIAGQTSALRDLLSGQSGKDENKKQVLAQVALIPSGTPIWMVAVAGFSPMRLPEQGNLANLQRVFQSLETALVALDLREGVRLSAQGVCKDEPGAKQLHNALRGLIGFGRLSTPADHAELLRFYDSIKVEQNKTEIKLQVDVPMDMVDQFLKATEKDKPSV
ncbi:MAG: hypothetical protein NZV14_09085 [Bryobacteraceae bacterium]|nr:hypothetical protein [Bryobacteraceae bacterium]MDW8378304.1 hypothetical protein [Bryobacterales bacterium]